MADPSVENGPIILPDTDPIQSMSPYNGRGKNRVLAATQRFFPTSALLDKGTNLLTKRLEYRATYSDSIAPKITWSLNQT